MDYVTKSGMRIEVPKEKEQTGRLKRYHQEGVVKRVIKREKEKPEDA